MEPEMMERQVDKEAKRKIQFSVPSSVPLQLDPRQVEMIRRRRPTPATLFKLTDPPSPEEESGPHQWVLGENGALKAKLVHMPSYQPPSLIAVQKMAEASLASLNIKSVDPEEPSSGEEEEQQETDELQAASAFAETEKRDRDPPRDGCHLSDWSHHRDVEDKMAGSEDVQGK